MPDCWHASAQPIYLASVLVDECLSSRVHGGKLGDVVDTPVNGEPHVTRLTVASHLIASDGAQHVCCLLEGRVQKQNVSAAGPAGGCSATPVAWHEAVDVAGALGKFRNGPSTAEQ